MTLPRREFLAAACCSALCGVGTLPAIEPIPRNGSAKFKFSLAAYSYRDLLTGDAPKLKLSEFVDDCAKFGAEGTELTSYYFPKNVTHDYLRSLRRQCFRLGLDISGTAVGNDFGLPLSDARNKQIASVKQWIEFAAVLGAPVIRIFAGHVPVGAMPAETHNLMVAGIEECCDFAGQHGVHLALENHGGPTATADGLLAFVRDVQSPWFGVNLDTGNFHSDDVYAELERAAPYALNVQVKVVVSGSDKKKRPTNYVKLAKILRDSNYRGYIVLEYEEADDPREACKKHLNEIRTAFA